MGGLLSRVRRLVHGGHARVLVHGLNGAGKTSLLSRVRSDEVVVPTLGQFGHETVRHNGLVMDAWEVGGRTRMGKHITQFYQGAHALVWVIESVDRDMLDGEYGDKYETVLSELQFALRSKELRGLPLLLFANKQDLPNAMTIVEITDRLDLMEVRGREWHMHACSVVTGDGITEGLQWLTEAIERSRQRIGTINDDDDDPMAASKAPKSHTTGTKSKPSTEGPATNERPAPREEAATRPTSAP